MDDRERLSLEPIGLIESPHRVKAEAPRQPRAALDVPGVITLFPGHGYDDALQDLEGFSHVWVLFWFHQSHGFRPKVLPPRSTKKRGVFATRAPYRPNPLGMSVLRLDRVEGLRLYVRDVDLLDQTPILDLKPYVAWTDAIPDAAPGWLLPGGDVAQAKHPPATQGPATPGGPAAVPGSAPGAAAPQARPMDPGPSYVVTATAEAEAQLTFLRAQGVELWARIEGTLGLGPQPHAYRRIKVERGGGYRLAVTEWRAYFVVEGRAVTVTRLGSGYPMRELRARPELSLHREFVALYP